MSPLENRNAHCVWAEGRIGLPTKLHTILVFEILVIKE